MYPLFIAGHDTMQKIILLPLKQQFTRDVVRRLSASSRLVPNVFAFESLLMLSKVLKLLGNQLQIILWVQLAPDKSLHEVMPPILRLQFFRCVKTFFIFSIKIIISLVS